MSSVHEATAHRVRSHLLAAVGVVGVLMACGAGRPVHELPDGGTRPTVSGRKTFESFDHPEDVEVVAERGVVLVSEMGAPRRGRPGSVRVLALDDLKRVGDDVDLTHARDRDVGDATCNPPERRFFHPHGLAAIRLAGSDVIRVAVVNHAESAGEMESIELFDLHGSGHGAALVWQGCIRFESGVYGNDVALDEAGTVFVTNSRSHRQGVLSKLQIAAASVFAIPSGDVRMWSRSCSGWKTLDNSRARFAAGIAVTPDGREVYVSEGAGGDVLALRRSGGCGTDATATRITVAGAPDNLSWDGDRLLVAVHTDKWAFVGCGRAEEAEDSQAECSSPWAVVALDRAADPPQVTCVACGDGDDIGGVSSASADGGRLWLGASFGTRIAFQQRVPVCAEARCPCERTGVPAAPVAKMCPSPGRTPGSSRPSAPSA